MCLLACAENRAARHRSDGRKLSAGIHGLKFVRGASGPAGSSESGEVGRLPLALLNGMRIEIYWKRRSAVLVLRARRRLRERADVRYEGELSSAEQTLQTWKLRMQTVGHIARLRDNREERVLRQREIRANAGVVRVARAVVGDDHVVAVVAAEKKDADQRAITGGRRRGECVDQVQAPDGGRHAE